jgi:hypothetical protein
MVLDYEEPSPLASASVKYPDKHEPRTSGIKAWPFWGAQESTASEGHAWESVKVIDADSLEGKTDIPRIASLQSRKCYPDAFRLFIH